MLFMRLHNIILFFTYEYAIEGKFRQLPSKTASGHLTMKS